MVKFYLDDTPPIRNRVRAYPKKREKDSVAYDAAMQELENTRLRRQHNKQIAIQNAKDRDNKNIEGAKRFNENADIVMSHLSNMSNGVSISGNQIVQAAENQRQEKLDKWHDIQKGIDAAITAGEMTAAGYGILRGLTHFNRMLARHAAVNGNTTAMTNLAKWNSRVDKVDKPQIIMNGIGGIADGYQWITADNKVDKYENGLETAANTAGVIGGTNWFRNLPTIRRFGNAIDTTLDGLGYGSAIWDAVKYLPPLSYYLDKGKQQYKENK